MWRTVLSLACAAGVLATPAFADSPVLITVDAVFPGRKLPADFTGLSFETKTLLPDKSGGHLFSATNQPLITLFRNLGLKNLRVGGATVDMANVRVPSPADIDHLFGFARAAGVKVIYSFRLLQGDPAANAALARQIWKHHRRLLDSFAIGNEPDWRSYHQSDPAITNYTSFLAAWKRSAAAIRHAAPQAVFSGPDTGGNLVTGLADDGPGPAWTTGLAREESRSGRLVCLTQHHYVGEAPGSLSAGEAIDAMLSPDWNSVSNQALYAAMAVPATATRLPFRFTEANDFTGGVTNASNAFASALWALDFLHWWAVHGAAGVNFHNKRWIPTDTIAPGPNGSLLALPRAYGIKAFNLGAHGRVKSLAIGNPDKLNLTAYASGDTSGLYVTVINKEHGAGARDVTVSITPSGVLQGAADVVFLSAPAAGAAATSGVTLGGAVIANNSRWSGRWTSLGRFANHRCDVAVPASSAAVIRIRPWVTPQRTPWVGRVTPCAPPSLTGCLPPINLFPPPSILTNLKTRS